MLHVLPLLLAGCVAAWRPDAPRRFDVALPDGWEVTRNVRVLDNDLLAARAPDGSAVVSVELIRSDRRSRELPLDLIAETRALQRGRVLGFENTRWRTDQIVIDGREAWAVTGRRAWRFVESDTTLVVTRTRTHVVLLTLDTPPGGLGEATPAWAGVLESFRLLRDRPTPDAPLWVGGDGVE